MKSLPLVTPTPEQLVLISDPRPGVQVIKGAAGSGKTTTALLMLRQLSSFWLRRKARMGLFEDTNILVVTFNRTLRGYIQELAEQQIKSRAKLNLTVTTFGRWAKELLPPLVILEENERLNKIRQLSVNIALPFDFIVDEVDYLLGRFPKSKLTDYVNCKREGRGASPRVDVSLRKELLDRIVSPYELWKKHVNRYDWNDLSAELMNQTVQQPYDIILADEAQDLSANQVRAIMHFAATPSSVIFILDAAQRIYPRGFTWTEAGISVVKHHRLKDNHRNTREICQFALPLLNGLDIGDDGTFPDFNSCVRNGPIPLVIKGRYSEQVDYVLDHIESNIDLASESVAFLKPLGGRWFDHLRKELRKHSLGFVQITREDEWPKGPENIALSTMHSAKGLEFDHVFVLGLNEEVTPHGSEAGDTVFDNLRRLLAVAITRAKESVIVGYKPGEASSLISLLDSNTYHELSL